MTRKLGLVVLLALGLMSMPLYAAVPAFDLPPAVIEVAPDVDEGLMPVALDNDLITNVSDPGAPDELVLPGAGPLDRTGSEPREGPVVACYLWDTESCVPRLVSEGPVPVTKV